MDEKQLISKLNEIYPGSVLEAGSFGRTGVLALWLNVQSLLQVSFELKTRLDWQLDWLENISVVELDGALVATYFLRSSTSERVLILRVSVGLDGPDQWVMFPSVAQVWPMAEPLEQETGQLFGIQFISGAFSASEGSVHLEFGGFPLRKSYAFPKGDR